MKLNYIIFFILGVAVLNSCSKDENVIADSGKIKTSLKREVYRQLIPRSGALLTVKAPGTALDSLRILVRAGTYPEDKEFVVAYYDIQSHGFGSLFHPVSPLIEVENGGKYADEVMYMTFKVPMEEHQKPAPFYYDRSSGHLESIPIISYSNGEITIAVRHFSLIVVGSFEKEVIELGGFFESYFDPAINGWSFSNEGTWASFGNCAGMSIGAAYYYQNRKTQLLLKDHFDNHGYWFQTPKLPYDDADGLRFVSALQSLFDKTWDGAYSDIFESNFTASDEDNFWSLVYSMYLNHDPQLVYVGNAVNSQYAHMVLATSFEFIGDEVHIQIYDPNYPNQLGIMRYNTVENRFIPYISAENSKAIEENRFYEFRQIVHIPLSTIVSKEEIDALFLKTVTHTVAEEIFPQYAVYANPLDTRFAKVKLRDALKGDINILPFDEFYITVEGTGSSDTSKFSEILHYLNPQTNSWEVQDPSGILKLVQPKSNILGIHITGERFGNPKIWVGYHYYKIEAQKIWLEVHPEEASINQEVEFVVRSNGAIPDGARFSWDFGNGKKKTTYNDSLVSNTYSAAGEYTVTVDVFDVTANKSFGKANASVLIRDNKYDRYNIIITGINGTDKPFLFDDGHRESTISYSNVPAFYPHPKLSWTGQSFKAEFDYGDTSIFYQQKLEGVLSDDLNVVKDIKAIYYIEDDQSIYESSVTFKNVPVLKHSIDQLIVDIRGSTTNAYVTHASVLFKSKLPTGEIIPKYSLANIDWSNAKIYFDFHND